ncbi:uncharacterized protein TNCV_1222111 [Trichonephila clavipes]|nr:uncharacterized protein TNCV_1222111 [Trichonephila clavipes]
MLTNANHFPHQKGISQVNMTNLRNLLDTSDEVLKGLKALETKATNRDPWLIQILMQKLDTETKRLWSVKTAEKDFSTLNEFLEFLSVRCSSLELMTCNDFDTKVPTKSNFIAYKNNPGTVLRPILSYGCPVWGYAAKTNINILDVAQNTLTRMIVGACRYMKNDEIRNAIKIHSFKSHIQKLAKNFFNSLNSSENVNMQNLENYTARIKRKRPRSILLDSYNPP